MRPSRYVLQTINLRLSEHIGQTSGMRKEVGFVQPRLFQRATAVTLNSEQS